MQDYYEILEVDYDADEDAIRSNYMRLALVSFGFCVLLFLLITLVLGWIVLIIYFLL